MLFQSLECSGSEMSLYDCIGSSGAERATAGLNHSTDAGVRCAGSAGIMDGILFLYVATVVDLMGALRVPWN